MILYVIFFLFILECVALLVWGLKRPGRVYEFPFLAAAVFTGWVLPQLVGLAKDPYLPPGGLEKTIFMSALCLGMCYLGYVWKREPTKMFNWSLSRTRLLILSAFFVLVGAYFFFLISRLPEELTSQSNWSGLPVLYLFFANILGYGFAIGLLLYMRCNSKIALGIALFASLFFVDRIFIGGRREVALEFSLAILLAFWFGQRKSLPRPIILAAIFFGALLFYSIGEYRAITKGEEGFQLKRIVKIEFLENFKRIIEDEGGYELRNAVYNIQAEDTEKSFDFGLYHWNGIVFDFVPRQILGEDFKSSLMIPLEDVTYTVYGYEPHTGTTSTGMTDTFRSFWYFGALKFFLIGYIMARLYRAAIRGNFVAQLFYMCIIVAALLSITHSTQWFFSGWVHIGIFLLPAVLLARTGRFGKSKISRPAYPQSLPRVLRER
ncbi:MAG: hypothetical protein WBD99_13400 [Thermodesulfobacteriota bacterium]